MPKENPEDFTKIVRMFLGPIGKYDLTLLVLGLLFHSKKGKDF